VPLPEFDECDLSHDPSADRDSSAIPNECDIADGTSNDANCNSNPEQCDCLGDIDGSDQSGQTDLGILLVLCGACEGQPNYDARADLNSDECVNQSDLRILLAHWREGCE